MTSSALVISNDSPTLVKVAARLAKVVFGARIGICDGVNDHVEIQAALDALPATGAELAFGHGEYHIEVSLAMDSYQTLSGCGRNTILTTTTAGVDIVTAIGGSGTEKVGILIKNLCIDGTAGGVSNNDDGIYWEYVDHSKIVDCWILNNQEDGISMYWCDNDEIIGCTINDSYNYGIEFYVCLGDVIADNILDANEEDGIYTWSSNRCVISGNTCKNSVYNCGIYVEASDNTIVSGNVCYNNNRDGMEINLSNECVVSDNVCDSNGEEGIECTGSYCTLVGNECNSNTYDGICIWYSVVGSRYCSVVGNFCRLNGISGIWVGNSHDNVIVGNLCDSNSQTTDNTEDNIYLQASDRNLITNNTCRQGIQTNRPKYGINISNSTCDENIVKDNDLYDSGKTAAFNDAGTGTKLPSITVPFSDGTEAQDSGYLIDLGGEYARAFSFLDLDVTQVVRMKVYARSVVLEADRMRAEFVVYGGADNEAYNTHNGSVANKASASSNFAADDVIYWTLTEAGILALTGGDSVEVKVLHEVAGDGDCETNAYFRTVTIEYV